MRYCRKSNLGDNKMATIVSSGSGGSGGGRKKQPHSMLLAALAALLAISGGGGGGARADAFAFAPRGYGVVGFGGGRSSERPAAAASDDELPPSPKNAPVFSSARATRRDFLASQGAAAALLSSSPAIATAADDDSASATAPAAAAATTTTSVPFGASWSAVDGLNSRDSKFVSFDASAYKAMRDDPTRTPYFDDAIVARLGNDPSTQTVLDLGTGPFALFALIAAEAGAGKVYAVEADPAAAESARECVRRSGYGDVVTVVEGFSSDISLPEKVDLCVAEVVGSVASEEGAYASIGDAARFLKDPTSDENWIPCRIQTYAAPASYTLHNLFGPPEFDWTKLNGEPVRFSCRDKGLELLADPVLVEDIRFADVAAARTAGGGDKIKQEKRSFQFAVSGDRIEDNASAFYDEYRRGGKSTAKESEDLAARTSRSFSGVALWPRLVLSEADKGNGNKGIVVDSRRYGDGAHQRSHWQTVLPVASGRPIPVRGGDVVNVETDFRLPSDVVADPPHYSIHGTVVSNGGRTVASR